MNTVQSTLTVYLHAALHNQNLTLKHILTSLTLTIKAYKSLC